MDRTLITIVISLLIGFGTNAQICAQNINGFFIDTCALNAGVRKIPKKTKNIKTIVKRINESCTTDQDKAYFIYEFIASNFVYDMDRFKSIKKRKVRRELYTKELLSKGKGVCGDYANFYKLLCDSVGVKCLRVNGYTSGGILFHTPEESTFDHSWNIISINEKWYYVDVTWALNLTSVSSKPKEVGHTSFEFLFAGEGEFTWSHMSGDPVYQLCTNKKTFKQFRWREKDLSTSTDDNVNRLIDQRYAMDEQTRYFAELQSQLDFSKAPEIEIFSGCFIRIQGLTDKNNPEIKKVTKAQYENAIAWYTQLKTYSGRLSKKDQKKLEYTIDKEIKDCNKKMEKLRK